MGFFFDEHGYARDPDGTLVTKSIDDAMWSTSMGVTGDGRITLKAAESLSRNLSPTEAYEQSIYVNKAVRAIAGQIAKAKLRLFKKSGEEITGGPLFELLKKPAPKTSYRRFMHEIVAWLNINGEYGIKIDQGRGSMTPSALYVLCPPHLQVHVPTTKPRTFGDVVKWRYVWADGFQDFIRSDHLIFDRFFNPHDTVRGLPPTVVGSLEIGGGHAISRYQKNFFDNNAEPSHLVKLGEGVGRQQREDFEKRYLAEFSTRRNNAFKAMVVSGKDVGIEQIGTGSKDGDFMELRKSIRDDISMLYHVPAANMGIFGETKQDTINDERKMFVEETLAPQAEMIAECLQYQLIDPFFSLTPTYSKKAVFTKAMAERFEEAKAERDGSAIIALIDLDTLPIMSAVKAAMIETAAKFRTTTMISPYDLSEYFDLDLNDTESGQKKERKEIWIENNLICATNPALNKALQPQPKDPAATSTDKKKKKGADAKRADAKRGAGKTKRTKACERSFRDLRRLTMEKMEAGELWSLAEADELCPGFDREVRIVRNRLSKAVTQDDARTVFNALDYSQLTGNA
jgi:HK97 family phage portal protein